MVEPAGLPQAAVSGSSIGASLASGAGRPVRARVGWGAGSVRGLAVSIALLGALLLGLAGTVGIDRLAGSFAPRVGGLLPRVPIASLPAAARAPVSQALGAADPTYLVRRAPGGFRAANPAQHLRVGFGRRGADVASGSLLVTFGLRAVGLGGSLAPVTGTSPRAHANRVSYGDGTLEGWYANGPLGLEQGFELARAPRGSPRRPLTLALALGGNAQPVLDAGGSDLTFSHAGHSLRYGGLLATDARGRVLRSWLQMAHGDLLLRVDTRGASYPVRIDPVIQTLARIAAKGEGGAGAFGYSVALSSGGSTALIGGPADEGGKGAAWVFTRSGAVWAQQGSKLIGASAERGEGHFGASVALSEDGDTALIGGPGDEAGKGAAWVFTRSGSTWTRQGGKLTATGESGAAEVGFSVALSSDGDTALLGAPYDSGETGAAWVFTRSGAKWAQQGGKLFAGSSEGRFGFSVALAGNGGSALIGGPGEEKDYGSVWFFKVVRSSWESSGQLSPQAPRGYANLFGYSVAMATDGETAIVGTPGENGDSGGAWVYVLDKTAWVMFGKNHHLVGSVASGEGELGSSVALSSDGDTALVGAPLDAAGNGAVWEFSRSGFTWAQQGEKLTAAEARGAARYGASVSLAGSGATALVGGPADRGGVGSAWLLADTTSGECTDSWTNTAGGSWFAGANWSKGTPPGPEDDACIDANGTYTVTMTQTAETGPVSVASLTVGGGSGAQTLAVGVCSSEDDGSLVAAGGFENRSSGAIVLASPTEGCGAPGGLALEGAIENDGMLRVEPVANGALRRLHGSLLNTGTLTFEANTAFDGAAAQLINDGTIDLTATNQLTLASGGLLTNHKGGSIAAMGGGDVLLSGATYVAFGGSTSGVRPVIVDDGTLDYEGNAEKHGSGTIAVRGNSEVTGATITSNETLMIESTCAENAVVEIAAGFAGNGLLEMTGADNCAKGVTLKPLGGVFAIHSLVTVACPHGGSRTIEGDVENVSGGRLKLEPKAVLHVTGSYKQESGGTLIPVIAGTSAFGSLVVGGEASLSPEKSQLLVRQLPQFEGSLGQSFPIVSASSLSGTFGEESESSIGSAGLYYYEPVYSSTEAKLVVST
jgi:hypothetical protein